MQATTVFFYIIGNSLFLTFLTFSAIYYEQLENSLNILGLNKQMNGQISEVIE
jgi:hypothetical protein